MDLKIIEECTVDLKWPPSDSQGPHKAPKRPPKHSKWSLRYSKMESQRPPELPKRCERDSEITQNGA